MTEESADQTSSEFSVHPGAWLRFETAFGVSADTLMRMQAAHDPAQVRAREGAIEVERVAA